jgi:CRISPR-associated protein Cmr6
MTINTSFYYYRSEDFGKGLNNKLLSEFIGDNSLEIARINHIGYFDYFNMSQQPYLKDKIQSFDLKTTYPGLIIGSGYNHPSRGKTEEDFQNGFYFDHTTGMPVIPGSTVKGILKAVFPKSKEDEAIKGEKIKYINGELEEIISGIQLTKDNWEAIFEKGNIFYDAYISDIPLISTTEGIKIKGIFAEDYITPHHPGEKMGMFKNPIPLRFLKIAPGVTFTFQFKLLDSCIDSNKLSANDKLKLFNKIIMDFGIGAKRNVGYGNLVE